MLQTEKELMFGSKPTPKRSNSFNRRASGPHQGNGNGFMTPSPRRQSFYGGATPELMTPRSHSGRYNSFNREMRRLSTAPLNFVAIAKDDSASTFTSVSGSEPESPLRRNLMLWWRLIVCTSKSHFFFFIWEKFFSSIRNISFVQTSLKFKPFLYWQDNIAQV